MVPLSRSMIAIRMPAGICASCGLERPTATKEVELKHSTSYLVVSTTRKLKIDLPFCAECLAARERAERKAGTVALWGIAVVIVAALIAGIALNNWTIACVVGVLGLMFGGLLAGTVGPRDVATYDGQNIKFTNPVFNARFHAVAQTRS